MKQKRLVSMIGALVVIMSAVALITGCSQANNSKGNTTRGRAVYVAQNGPAIFTMMFEANGTFKLTLTEGGAAPYITGTGIYTGDASQDGPITITQLKKVNDERTGFVDYTGPNATVSSIISGGKFTIGILHYTRQ